MATQDSSARPDEGAARGGRWSPSRRTVARGLAWSGPAVALSVTAPALAASSDIAVTVVASCSGRTGIITVAAAFVPSGAELQITLTHSGSGSFTAQPQFPHTGTGTTYIVEGTGAPFTGQISVQLTGIGQNATGTVTADVSSPDSVVTGTTRARISARREGNSQNYVCSTGS